MMLAEVSSARNTRGNEHSWLHRLIINGTVIEQVDLRGFGRTFPIIMEIPFTEIYRVALVAHPFTGTGTRMVDL